MEQPSLSSTIFRSMFATLTGAVLVLAITLSSVYYQSSESKSVDTLKQETIALATLLNKHDEQKQIALLEEQLTFSGRITLISADGQVIYDNKANSAELASHSSRPEFVMAQSSGQAISHRQSDTLNQDLVYAAAVLDNNSVIRLSEIHQSFLDYLRQSAGGIVIILATVILILYFVSKFITNKIMKPISSIDIGSPLANSSYTEMRPLFERIDEQRTQLKSQNAELKEAANMRRDFSSNVSHEMKSPLQVISGYAELIETGIAGADDTQKFAGLIRQEATSMRELINDILTLSRLDESALGEEMQTVDLEEIINQTYVRLVPLAKNNNVTIDTNTTAVRIHAHATLIEEAIYNLINNAIRYNVWGGNVEITLMSVSANSKAVIAVKDTGPGIPGDMREKVFERFFRVDSSRSKETGGTGLGLAIVKHVVDVHGGTIELKSEAGKGSEFIVSLPLA